MARLSSHSAGHPNNLQKDTTMHPAGCFGSFLAFSETSRTCTACSGRDECSQIVLARRPITLKLLSRFSDGKGDTMDAAWLTPQEKLDRRQKRLALTAKPTSATTVRQAILTMLKTRAHTRQELIAGVAQRCSYSEWTARRKTSEQLAALRSEGRLETTGRSIALL